MIPLRLQVRNFLSYRDDVPPLLFDGFKLACLSGLNGHGKSALLDAITWALWGKARASNDDELVHLGRDEVEVQFDFQLGPNQYRVIRKRAFHGRRGAGRSTLALDFQVRGPSPESSVLSPQLSVVSPQDSALSTQHLALSAYRSLAGDSARQTQQEIERRLRLDYETFVHSAFILQGKADAFTTKPPNERKRILGELIGLWQYDALETRAREHGRALEGQQRAIETAIADLERQLAERPRWEREREDAGQAATLAEAALKAAETELDGLRERRAALEQKARDASALQARVERAQRRLSEDEERLAKLAAAIAATAAIIAARPDLERQLAERDRLRQRLENLEERKDRETELQRQAADLHLAIERVRGELATQQASQAERVRTLRQEAAPRDGLAQAVRVLSAECSVMGALSTQHSALSTALAEHQARQGQLQLENKRLEDEGKRLKQQAELLTGAEAACPTCGSPLAPGQREDVLALVEAEREQRRTAYRRNADEIKRLGDEAHKAQRDLEQAERRLKDLQKGQERLVELRSRLERAERAAQELPTAERALAEFECRLAENAYAAEERARLAEIETERAVVAYDPEEHQTMRDGLAALGDLDRRWAALEEAERAIARHRGEHQDLAERLAEQRAELDEDARRAEKLAAEVAALPAVRAQAEDQERRCQGLAGQAQGARERVARAEQMLDYLAGQHSALITQHSALRKVAEDRALYAELAEAFSKRGVQAMLIEQVLPELEDEANRLLARLTEGCMHVRFETQRAKRSDEGIIETLDIRIGDELGMRPYELYSGGEAFRVNFAIRIALSKLLARRAGAQVQMLVVDEGFGTQDERGCERLVEAINAISDEFEKVLVITHVERLKDFFPVRIEVTKTPEAGSQFVVV